MANNKLGSSTMANIISLLALILAAMSFFYTYSESKKRDKEIIDVSSKKVFPKHFVKFDKGLPQLVLHSYWETILTNNGEKTVSIKEYDVKCLKNRKDIIYYTGINQGIYDDELNQLNLPINISPGESKRIYSKIGVMISKEASDIILDRFNPKKNYLYRDIKVCLAKNSIDIFNNQVDAKISGDKIEYFRLENSDYNKDVFGITFTSGRNNQYIDILKWYPEIDDLR